MQTALIEMDRVYCCGSDPAELGVFQHRSDSLQILGAGILSYTPKSQVWREGTFLFFVSQADGASLDALLQRAQRCRSMDANPEDARPLPVWERVDAAKLQVKHWVGIRRLEQHLFQKVCMGGGNIPDKFQRQMHILHGNPANKIISQRVAQGRCLFFD